MGLMQIVCVLLCCLAIGHADTDIDPCLNHTTLRNLGSRNELCVPGDIDLYDLLCDSYLPTDWYITENAVMLNHEPKTGSCGVDIPLWMRETIFCMDRSIPKISDGIMDRDVCVKTDGDACKETISIQIKNCSSFYVYKLQRLPDDIGCPAAYCFVSDDLCREPKILTTKTTYRPIPTSDGQGKTDERTTDSDIKKDVPQYKTTSALDEGASESGVQKGDQHYKTTTALIACLTISVCVIAVLVVAIVLIVLRRKRHSGIGAAEKRHVEPVRCGQESLHRIMNLFHRDT